MLHVFEEKSDEDLIRLLQIGDRKAFSVLYDRYWLDLVKKAVFKLGNQDDAEEVVQNVFVNIWKWRQSIHLKGYFKPYLYRILKNEVFRFIADRLKEKNHIQLDEISGLDAPSDISQMKQLEFKELQDQIDFHIQGLPEKCRLIFQMSREDGLTAKQIANELQISPRTVETQLSKAVRKLKDAIQRLNILLFL